MNIRKSATSRQSRPRMAALGLALLAAGSGWLLWVMGVIP